jgi:ribosomal 50S subunit-recycling heat shock protein
MSDSDLNCRIDVWLWRTRLLKSRSLAAELVEAGRVRLTRGPQETRLDKPSRTVKPGDIVTFALAGRLHVIRVEAMGERRGPASEAQRLYTALQEAPSQGPH